METKINIAAILKDKPQGTKLYDWLHNIDVELDTISTTDTETVVWCTNETNNNTTCHRGYSEFGTERGYPDGLQILFPSKEMRDWTKFSWKKGDVLANGEGDYCVFKEFAHSSYQTSKAVFVKRNKESIQSYSCLLDTKDWHKASHSCTATYINTIEKELSGKLNMETLEIEKAQPEFKDWDFITIKLHRGRSLICVFKAEDDENYYLHANLDSRGIITIYEDSYCPKNGCITRLSTEEEKAAFFDALAKKGKTWDVEKKKIIALKQKWTPKPFNRVITRNADDDIWTANIFSHMDSHGEYVTIGCVGGYTYCIPYNEETAKLIGTTNNVEG